jgi:hypothetical protein
MEITKLRTQKQYIKTLRRIIKIMDSAPGTAEYKELETRLSLLKKYERKYVRKSLQEAVA